MLEVTEVPPLLLLTVAHGQEWSCPYSDPLVDPYVESLSVLPASSSGRASVVSAVLLADCGAAACTDEACSAMILIAESRPELFKLRRE